MCYTLLAEGIYSASKRSERQDVNEEALVFRVSCFSLNCLLTEDKGESRFEPVAKS